MPYTAFQAAPDPLAPYGAGRIYARGERSGSVGCTRPGDRVLAPRRQLPVHPITAWTDPADERLADAARAFAAAMRPLSTGAKTATTR